MQKIIKISKSSGLFFVTDTLFEAFNSNQGRNKSERSEDQLGIY